MWSPSNVKRMSPSSHPIPNPRQWTTDITKEQASLIDSSDTSITTTCVPSEGNTSRKPLDLEIQKDLSTRNRRHKKQNVKLVIACLISVILAAPWIKMSTHLSQGEDEPNPPTLPDSMIMFFPPQNEYEIQKMQASIHKYSDPILTWEEFTRSSSTINMPNHPEFTYTSINHFSSQRTALLFTPGIYPVDIQIGYYTSLYGLGIHPDNVTFTGEKGPFCPALDKFTDRPPHGSGLNSFWRSVENIATKPKNGMTWAVSQAAPLRRVHVHADLNLFDSDSWVSGGFTGNLLVEGNVNFGGQQQWISRNVQMKQVSGGAWSLVLVGCTGNIPAGTDSAETEGPAVSVEEEPRVRLEKPYIALKVQSAKPETNRIDYEFELRIPLVKHNKDTTGAQFDPINEVARDFQRVKLLIPSTESDAIKAAIENHSTIQNALNHGKDVVLSPGIYPLSSALEVKHPNQVILGLGYATLVAPTNGMPCIHVHSKTSGVRIAGIMLEASVLKDQDRKKCTCLLEWGEDGVLDNGDASDPGLLSDVFARVGGASYERNVSTDAMIVLHSGNIIGDNIWLWRADHVALHPGESANFLQISPLYRQSIMNECQVKSGLVVNGDNITIFGLAVEHTTQDQVLWSGEDGVVYFYQSELPYDVDQSYAHNRYVGYRVNAKVKRHAAYGVGIYSNFRDHDVNVSTAVTIPEVSGVRMTNIFTVKLDNIGKICSIVNGRGPGPTPDTGRGVPLRCVESECVLK